MTEPQEKTVSGGVKLILRLEAAMVLIVSCLMYRHFGYDWNQFFIYFLLPDIGMLGYLAGSKIGSIAYNSAHNYIVPLAIGTACYELKLDVMSPFVLIWIAHIGFDRMLGYGLKYATSFGDTHLGKIGKWKSKA